MLLLDVCSLLKSRKIPYAVVGGQAVALHGAVRGTIDIDIVTEWSLTNLKKIEKALTQFGLQSRLPITAIDIYQFKDEYIKNRNLIAWNFYHPQRQNDQVDIVITFDLTGKHTKTVRLLNGTVRILALDELINMKKQTGREQDQLDVKALQKLKKN